VHAKGGSWLANGSADGLVEIEIDPPCHTGRSLSTLFRRMKVTEAEHPVRRGNQPWNAYHRKQA
jgi:hypothetical protein